MTMTNEVELKSEGNTFPGYINKPSGKIKGGLIVIHEVWGLTDHIQQVADRFAQEGYFVIAPDLLNGTSIDTKITSKLQEELFDPEKRNLIQPKLRELMAPINAPHFAEHTLSKLDICLQYLEAEKSIQNHIGVVGFCFGGSYSFNLAVHNTKLKAAVAFYGHCNFSVEQLRSISCPILAFYGENDENLMSGLPDLVKKMKETGVNFSYKTYKNSGHAFFNDSNRFSYNEAAAKDAWQKTIKFLETNLNLN